MPPLEFINSVVEQVRRTGSEVIKRTNFGGRPVLVTVSLLPTGGIDIKQRPLGRNAAKVSR